MGAGGESEKDSGFSDASSEYLSALEQTDTEELPRRGAARRLPLQQRPRLARSFAGLGPVYIVKNVLVKQPPGASSDAQLVAWSGRPEPEPAQGQARLLLLQQPVPAGALQASPPGPKTQGEDTYAPLLDAYAKIAPRPGRPRDVPEAAGAVGVQKPSEQLRPSAKSAGKQRRFRNTVEILRRSGLLGITLRTKELLRQNGGTQRELAELREHARLLGEAARTNDARAWARLQRAVGLTAAYWARRGAELLGPAADLADGAALAPASGARPRGGPVAE
ncbi:CLOCK-interacting pacemaker-like [Rhea pennata]|uniref:CLOCK-interacting pacemaker-like n=1 Tax=Rhea pennata TaxID=8795 RepID=UPI002E26FCF1